MDGNASTPQAPASPAADWTAGLNDSHKGFVQNKGFKDPAAVLDSYINYEKLIGVPAERLLKMPENMDSPEGKAIWERLGMPKDAKEYQIDIPKENGDPKLADWFREEALKSGFTKKQAESFMKAWNARQEGLFKESSDAQAAKFKTQETALKTEWGAALDQNIQIAQGAAAKFGVTKDQIDALEDVLGYDGVMKLFHGFGQGLGEHNFINGGKAPGVINTPQGAQAKINELIQDKGFHQKLMNKDAEAVKMWNALHAQLEVQT